MDEPKLTQIADTFLRNHYGFALSIPIKRNNRLRSTYGRFKIHHNEPYNIELAGVLLDYGKDDVIIDILKHECIHYALFKHGLPHRDGSPHFEKELKKHGAPKTRKLLIGKFHIMECTECGKTSLTGLKRALTNPDDYRMSCCHAKINIIGERIFDGMEQY